MDLADKLGVSLRTIGNWEQLGRVPPEKLARLGEVLGFDPNNLQAAPPAPSEINYRGWKFTFTPAPGATPEQVRRAEDLVLQSALEKLRELGLEAEGDSGPN